MQPHLPPGGDALEVRGREPPFNGSGWWLGPGVELSLNPRVWSIGSRLRGYLMSAPDHSGNKLRLNGRRVPTSDTDTGCTLTAAPTQH